MMSARRSLSLVLVAAAGAAGLLGACGSSEDAPAAAEAPPPPPPALADAAVDGVTQLAGFDPASGAHLDDDAPDRPRTRAARRAGRPIEIMLRSSPSGARVHADGVLLGTTPTMWAGETGEHEFTFVLPRHALARYRFHAIATGVVHARLEPVSEEREPGAPPSELAPPGIAAPATVISPDAGAPVEAPAPADAAPAPAVVPAPMPVPVPPTTPELSPAAPAPLAPGPQP